VQTAIQGTHDRLDVRLAHAVDDDVGGQPVVGEDVEGVVSRVAAELVGDGLAERPSHSGRDRSAR
jgi:hypothetical protein